MNKKNIIIASIVFVSGLILGSWTVYQPQQTYILESRESFSKEDVKKKIFDECFNFYADSFRDTGISNESIALCWAKAESSIKEVEKYKENNL